MSGRGRLGLVIAVGLVRGMDQREEQGELGSLERRERGDGPTRDGPMGGGGPRPK
jgi:hypothetical protein